MIKRPKTILDAIRRLGDPLEQITHPVMDDWNYDGQNAWIKHIKSPSDIKCKMTDILTKNMFEKAIDKLKKHALPLEGGMEGGDSPLR